MQAGFFAAEPRFDGAIRGEKKRQCDDGHEHHDELPLLPLRTNSLIRISESMSQLRNDLFERGEVLPWLWNADE